MVATLNPSGYTFVEYSADWSAAFELEADRLRSLLGDTIVGIHHVGSTSVPALAAKPVIDLLPLVLDLPICEAMRQSGRNRSA
ncbi:MAG: GrpB family protein [Casimicrobiaceae bacterium]